MPTEAQVVRVKNGRPWEGQRPANCVTAPAACKEPIRMAGQHPVIAIQEL